MPSSDVNKPCRAYNAMAATWEMIEALRGGTEAMREAGTKYLPKEPGESQDSYDVRLSRTFLFPALEKTIKGLSGQVFRKNVTVGEDLLPQLAPMLTNIDMAGRDVEVFSRDVFESVLADGITHIHVDYPVAEEGITLEDERRRGYRPYLRHISAEDLIGWWSVNVGGNETLIEVRIREEARLRDEEWGERFVKRVRVLRPGSWQLWEEGKDDNWTVIGEGIVTMPVIPIVSIYGGRTGFMTAVSPLQSLANLNVCHWQSSSDQRNILRIARVPILFGAGISLDQGKSLPVGVNQSICSENAQATLTWVEHSGQAISSGKADLDDLKEEMAIVGLELLTRRPGNETATSRAITKAEADSSLAAMVSAMESGLMQCLDYMAAWLGIEQAGGTITMNRDFGFSEDAAANAQTILLMRQSREISRETFFKEMVRLGVLSPDIDVEVEDELLAAESAAFMTVPPPTDEETPEALPEGEIPQEVTA